MATKFYITTIESDGEISELVLKVDNGKIVVSKTELFSLCHFAYSDEISNMEDLFKKYGDGKVYYTNDKNYLQTTSFKNIVFPKKTVLIITGV